MISTLGQIAPAIHTLTRLLEDHPDLLTDNVDVGRVITSHGIELGVHVTLHEATGIDRDTVDDWLTVLSVEHTDQRPAATTGYAVLNVAATYQGTPVHLRYFSTTAKAA
jgi:hypothetical protein